MTLALGSFNEYVPFFLVYEMTPRLLCGFEWSDLSAEFLTANVKWLIKEGSEGVQTGAQPAFLCLTFLNIVFSNSANAHVLNTVLRMTNFSPCAKDSFTKFLKLIDFEQIEGLEFCFSHFPP